jgi:hypothetical protein
MRSKLAGLLRRCSSCQLFDCRTAISSMTPHCTALHYSVDEFLSPERMLL